MALAGPVEDSKAGRTALEVGHYDAAVRFFTRVLNSAPLARDAREEAYFRRGLAYLHLHRFDRARADLRRAVAIRPDDVQAAGALEMARAGQVPERGSAGVVQSQSVGSFGHVAAHSNRDGSGGASIFTNGGRPGGSFGASSGANPFSSARAPAGSTGRVEGFGTREPFSSARAPAGRAVGFRATIGVVATDAPLLPWPPYSPSSRGDVTQFYSPQSTYGGIDQAISKRLASFGYAERSYFSIPNGFAILTPLEQIDDQGKPVLTDRWVGRFGGATQLDFAGYVRLLLSGRRGRYRMFLFLASDTDFAPGPDVISPDAVKRWERSGTMALSTEFAARRLPQDAYVRLFVYEFTDNNSQSGGIVQQGDGSLTFSQHARSIGLAP